MDSLNLYDMRFKRGQQVVCIHEGPWKREQDGLYYSFGPKYGEVVTIKGECYWDKSAFLLEEYRIDSLNKPCAYYKKWFIPTIEITEIHELLSAVPQTERA